MTPGSPSQAFLRDHAPGVSGRVGLAVPDGTRPVDVTAALAALAPFLPASTTVVVGLGLHRRMHPHELPVSPFPLVQHDPDDTVPTATVATATAGPVPGSVARPLAEADTVLALGIVELHQYAGFSGGHKAVAVGCGGRGTLDALHHRDLVCAPGVEIGRIEGNPFRTAVDALGEAARCAWCLLQAGDRWFAGPPATALREAAASLDCWWDVPDLHDAAVLRVRGPKAANFYQASRAATYVGLSAHPPLRPGATLYLEAACPEGLGDGDGERAFARVLAATPPPWTELLDGPAPTGAGTQRALMIAALLRRYRLVVCGLADPAPLRALGIEATSAAAPVRDALVIDDPFGRLPRHRPRQPASRAST